MNTVKKISTLFALALISQSSFASETPPADQFDGDITFDVPANFSYTPTRLQMDAGGDVRSAMQNALQNANVANTTNLQNEMQLADVYGSDIQNNMTSNTNAMNSNAGSSYNDSTNTINTTSTDSSTNTNTTTLDSGRNQLFTNEPANDSFTPVSVSV